VEKGIETLKRKRERVSRENSESEIKVAMGKKSKKIKEGAEERRKSEDLNETMSEIVMQENGQKKPNKTTSPVDESSVDTSSFEFRPENSNGNRSDEWRTDEIDYTILKKKRDINLKKNKMVHINGNMIYEEDMTEEQKRQNTGDDNMYRRNHVGWKIVEATLISSARVSCGTRGDGQIRMLKFGKGYRITTSG